MSHHSTPVIEVENVTQRFRLIHERPDTLREAFANRFRKKSSVSLFEALRNISFNVYKGEMLGVLGANGSGKSTLLKLITGVYRPSEGHIHVRGKMTSLIELGSGMHPELTGRENIVLNGLLMGYSKREMKEREQRILDFAEIGEFIDVPLKQYSSGMYARLAFSVATEVDPDILIVDEILAVGDAAFQAKSFERMLRFKRSGKTIVFVSHAVDHVLSHCDRALVLRKGSMEIIGSAREAVECYMPGKLAAASALSEAKEQFLASVQV